MDDTLFLERILLELMLIFSSSETHFRLEN